MGYPELAAAAAELFYSASDAELAQQISWTPLWSARDVLAHLVSGAERAVARVPGVPSDDEAHRAVLGLRGESVAALTTRLVELAGRAELPVGVPSQEWDIAVHLADIAETWGCPQLADELWLPVWQAAPAFLDQVGQLDVELVSPTASWGAGEQLRLVSDYKGFRAIFGRRMDALDQVVVQGDPERLGELAFFS